MYICISVRRPGSAGASAAAAAAAALRRLSARRAPRSRGPLSLAARPAVLPRAFVRGPAPGHARICQGYSPE